VSTYYISAASGSDVNSGLSEALAWATVDKGMNTVAAGDKVWVKGDGDYAELATIDTVGTVTSPIVFEGYTTTPGDGGRATITGSDARANCVVDSTAATTPLYYVFKNFRFTAATGTGFLTDGHRITFKNCKFDTNGLRGLHGRTLSCEACEFTSNTSDGCWAEDSGATIVSAIFIACKFYSNGARGLLAQSINAAVYGCIFFSNATSNCTIGGNDDKLVSVINCTFDGDAKDSDTGIIVGSTGSIFAFVNLVLYDCTTGLDATPGNMGELVISRNNLVNANTTAYVSAATFTGEVTSAPQFTNEVAGADYTPAAGSPLINAGLNG